MRTTNPPAAAAHTKLTQSPSVAKAPAKPALPDVAKRSKQVSAKGAAKPTPAPRPTARNKAATKKAPATAKTTAIEKPAKVKKAKMVRDSFTFPKPEFEVLADLKLRAAELSVAVKKTELIRAGIKALAAMGDAHFLAAIRAVPNLKTGRPAKA